VIGRRRHAPSHRTGFQPFAGYSTVSALWSVGYDAGMGAGAVGFGALAALTGYPAAFAPTAAAKLLPLGLMVEGMEYLGGFGAGVVVGGVTASRRRLRLWCR
jgi:hypothetical protein